MVFLRTRDSWKAVSGAAPPRLSGEDATASIAERGTRARVGFNDRSDNIIGRLWTPLGPVPLASDASGSRVQDYHQVAGRATTVAIDPGDLTSNPVYISGAQAGLEVDECRQQPGYGRGVDAGHG